MSYEADSRAEIKVEGDKHILRFRGGNGEWSENQWPFPTHAEAIAFRDETLERWDKYAPIFASAFKRLIKAKEKQLKSMIPHA